MEIRTIYIDKQYIAKDTCCACIGFFDGVHIGHIALINETLNLSKKYQCKSAVICFDEDPWVVMGKIPFSSHITPHHKQMEIFESLGIDIVYLLHFTREMMSTSKENFIHSILEPLHIHTLVCGTDFTFADKGEGNVETLKQGNFDLKVLDLLQLNETKISSRFIEQYIKEGKILYANQMLGYSYEIEGTVIHGAHKGTGIGFPTANLKANENYIYPKQGVYAGRIRYQNKEYKAMINIGHNPTMNYQENVSMEANILDFNKIIYGEEITFIFDYMIRDEVKFNNVQELIDQLNKDVEFTRNYER